MIIVFFRTVIAACLIIPLLVDYHRRKRFYNGFLLLLDELEQKNLIAEIMERPGFRRDDSLRFPILQIKRCSKRDKRNTVKAQEEYRGYIEMWIHEIKTPIASSRLVLENHKETPAAKKGSRRILMHLKTLWSKCFLCAEQCGRKDYMIRKTNLKDIVYAVARRNAKMLIERRIRLETENLDICVNTDAKWIEFVLNQIVGMR